MTYVLRLLFNFKFAQISHFYIVLIKGGGSETEPTHLAWDKWLGDGTEQEVAKLMGEDVGAAMQYLQSKALCIMPISLAAAIYPVHQSDGPTLLKTESRAPL